MARAALSADEQRQVTQQTLVNNFGQRVADIEQPGYLYRYQFRDVAPTAASSTDVLAAVTLASGAPTVKTAFLKQPDVARNLRFTTTLAAGNLDTNTLATIVGTDINGNPITEALDLAGGAGNFDTLNAFLTVSSITVPQRKTAGDTCSVGLGPRLGLPKIMFSDSVVLFQTDLAKDTYTLTKSATAVSLNLITPNNALNAARKYRIVLLDERV